MVTIKQRESDARGYAVLYIMVDFESLMVKWLEQASQWHEIYCHDLEVTTSNLSWVKLWVGSTSVLSRAWTKYMNL